MENESGANFYNLSYFFNLIYERVLGGGTLEDSLEFITQVWVVVTILAILISIIAIWVLVYSFTRLYQIRQEEEPLYATISRHDEHERLEDSRWQHVKQLIVSNNENDWRQAVMEGDIILDELLTRLGYVGDSVGEKLRMVNPSHFGTLNNAWEAHKVRNQIAHEGSAYQVTDRLAYRAIANYEAVFREHDEI